VHESMVDLVKLLSTLVDSSGRITVDGIYDAVAPMTPEEEVLLLVVRVCCRRVAEALLSARMCLCACVGICLRVCVCMCVCVCVGHRPHAIVFSPGIQFV
jgi:hypothetical protein